MAVDNMQPNGNAVTVLQHIVDESETSTPTRAGRYRGVRQRSWGRWVSEIRLPHQRSRLWLGSYRTPQAAARAYDTALLCLRGPCSQLNLPSSPPQIPHTLNYPALSPPSIRRIALAEGARFDRFYSNQPSYRVAANSSPCIQNAPSIAAATASGDGPPTTQAEDHELDRGYAVSDVAHDERPSRASSSFVEEREFCEEEDFYDLETLPTFPNFNDRTFGF